MRINNILLYDRFYTTAKSEGLLDELSLSDIKLFWKQNEGRHSKNKHFHETPIPMAPTQIADLGPDQV